MSIADRASASERLLQRRLGLADPFWARAMGRRHEKRLKTGIAYLRASPLDDADVPPVDEWGWLRGCDYA